MRRKLWPYFVLLVMCYGVFVAADDLTVVSTVLTSILYDLNIEVTKLDQAAWIVTSYLLGYVVTMPLLGRLSDLFGRRRAYVLSMAFFVLGSFFCATARDFAPLLGARVITAFGGGAVVPIAMAAVGDLFPPDKRGFALGTVGAVDTLGWVFGPLYGAWMTEHFDGVVRGWLRQLSLPAGLSPQGWRWLFWINLPLGALAILSALWALRGRGEAETEIMPSSPGERAEPEQAPPPYSFALLAGGALLSALVLLLGLRRPGWLGLLIPLGLLGLAALLLGAWQSRRQVDYAGGIALTVALVALNAALSGRGEGDWLELARSGTTRVFSPYLWPLLGLAAVAALLFVLRERRAAHPFLDLDLFGLPAFRAANLANLLIGAGLIIAMVDVPLFVVAVQGGSPVDTGLAIAPFTGAIVVAALAGGYLTERLGYRLPGLVGLLCSALGFAAMSGWTPLVTASTMRLHLALCGCGFGLVFAPIGTAVVNAVPKLHTGIASALVVILRLVGMSLGLSALTTWGLHRLNVFMRSAPDPLSQGQAYWEHLSWATSNIVGEIFGASALLCLLALPAMFFLGRPAGGERRVHGMR
ncbi:MAG: MFS transporter [Chloroflexia bacterium]|nr:MFS transporter [Chloroflexia bacterium]